MRADVDLKQDKKFVQTLHCTLPIREDLTPSISDNAKLLEIFYKVHIKVQLQEGSYQTMAGDIHNYMSVEVPLLIGTVPLMIGKKMVSPRKVSACPATIAASAVSNGSKKSDGSKDNDAASVRSAELNKKQGSGLFGRKSIKHEPTSEKKNGSFRKIFNWSGSKSKLKDDSATVVSASNSNSGNNKLGDEEPIQNYSGFSSSKNTDYDQRNSFHNGSQTSQSVSSPRMEMDPLTAKMQDLNFPRSTTSTINNDTSKTHKPFKITDSSTELKPDVKDDEIFDFELLAAINKSKADAETAAAASGRPTSASTFSNPQGGDITDIDPTSPAGLSTSMNTTTTALTTDLDHILDKARRQSGSIKEDDIFDNGTDGRPRSPMSVPTTITSNNDAAGTGRGRAVTYHNIFESSDDEEYDDEDEAEQRSISDQQQQQQQQPSPSTTADQDNGISYHSPFMDSDDDGNSDEEANDETEDGRIIKPAANDNSDRLTEGTSTSYYRQQQTQHQLPSPPPDQQPHRYTGYKGNHDHSSSSSSDESDDSPLNLMSKRSRQRWQQQ